MRWTFRVRAVRMVFEHQGDYSTHWKAIESMSAKLQAIHETPCQWVGRAETDAGWPGLTTDEQSRPPSGSAGGVDDPAVLAGRWTLEPGRLAPDRIGAEEQPDEPDEA